MSLLECLAPIPTQKIKQLAEEVQQKAEEVEKDNEDEAAKINL